VVRHGRRMRDSASPPLSFSRPDRVGPYKYRECFCRGFDTSAGQKLGYVVLPSASPGVEHSSTSRISTSHGGPATEFCYLREHPIWLISRGRLVLDQQAVCQRAISPSLAVGSGPPGESLAAHNQASLAYHLSTNPQTQQLNRHLHFSAMRSHNLCKLHNHHECGVCSPAGNKHMCCTSSRFVLRMRRMSSGSQVSLGRSEGLTTSRLR